jgi:hypothetical protein
MKTIDQIKISMFDIKEEHKDSYAQYLLRTQQLVNTESYVKFLGAHYQKRKIAHQLKIIGGLDYATK